VLRSELVPDALFAASFVLLLRREAHSPIVARVGARGAALSRRRLLRQTGIAVAVIAGGVLVWEGVSAGLGSIIGLAGRHRPQLSLSNSPATVTPPTPNYGDWPPVAGQTPEITATKDFYYVSKNLVSDPSINPAQWSLKIAGMVNAPYSLSYDELRALPAVQQYHTLECISNDVGGNLMSNALFTGVRLADVLNKAGIQSGASQVVFRADDGYSDSLHLSQALNPDSLIVYLINGDPLPQAHGYPARLLIPGLYGMKNGKWLTSLTIGSGTFDGYWEQRGWTREAMIKMTARIDVPSDGDLLTAKPTAIAGVAYAGDRGVGEVDVSVDGGRTWRVATLRRPLGALTWVLWELPWTPSAGNHIIVARAIDSAGNVQTTAGAPPIPDGASGYDAISVVAH
ncbi:MAG TPA: molybdopterin-dependent oxidoreductase, partial [Ktedonobacterales bacterium]|nr:molybdopterin-dependent oxidoreductase [Ktedonobacterales bacterium]